jgi:ADP-dependent phosphofructokinase/glucokinase
MTPEPLDLDACQKTIDRVGGFDVGRQMQALAEIRALRTALLIANCELQAIRLHVRHGIETAHEESRAENVELIAPPNHESQK